MSESEKKFAVGSRLAFARRSRHIKRQADLARLLGGFSRMQISRAEAGVNLPPPEMILKLITVLDLSPAWLLMGEGPMSFREAVGKPGPVQDAAMVLMIRETANVGVDRGTPEHDAKRLAPVVMPRRVPAPPAETGPNFHVTETVEAGYNEIGREDVEGLPPARRKDLVPIVGRIAAGAGIATVEAGQFGPGDADSLLIYSGAPPGCFAVKIEGRSMEPKYLPRDIVIADPARPAAGNGREAVVIYRDRLGEGVASLKRFSRRGRKFRLASLAAGFKPVDLEARDFIAAYEVMDHLPLRRRKKGE